MFDNLRDFWEDNRTKIIIISLVGAIAVCLFVPFGKQSQAEETQQASSFEINSTSKYSTQEVSSTFSINNNGNLYVDIKGAVNHPGAYQMNDNQRVGDVIEKAGGLISNADLNRVNLAQKLNDQMIIYVPRKGETIPISLNSQQTQNNNPSNSTEATANSNAEQHASSTGKINLNTATLDQLQQLDGVGEKKAQKIINYRQQHNGFKQIDELKNVDGIGDKSFEKLSSQVCV